MLTAERVRFPDAVLDSIRNRIYASRCPDRDSLTRRRRSSMAEHGFRKAGVVGSTPTVGSLFWSPVRGSPHRSSSNRRRSQCEGPARASALTERHSVATKSGRRAHVDPLRGKRHDVARSTSGGGGLGHGCAGYVVLIAPSHRATNILKNFCRDAVHSTKACYTFSLCKPPKGACTASEIR